MPSSNLSVLSLLILPSPPQMTDLSHNGTHMTTPGHSTKSVTLCAPVSRLTALPFCAWLTQETMSRRFLRLTHTLPCVRSHCVLLPMTDIWVVFIFGLFVNNECLRKRAWRGRGVGMEWACLWDRALGSL